MTEFIKRYLEAISRRYDVKEYQAFEIFAASLILDKPFDEIINEVWTGPEVGSDGGFDGIDIDEDAGVINILQSKIGTTLGENKVTKLKTDFNNIFRDGNILDIPLNTKTKGKLDEYKEIVGRGKPLSEKLYFVYLGNNNDPEAKENKNIFDRHNKPTEYPSLEIVDSGELQKQAKNILKTRREKVEFTFHPLKTNIETVPDQALFSFALGDVRAVNFRASAEEFCQLIKKEYEVNGTTNLLFTENVRGFLGYNQTNKRIRDTLLDGSISFNFPFLNNGITIICEEMNIPRAPSGGEYYVPALNPVVVNGLQTSRVIWEVYNTYPDKLKGVYLTIRLYATKDQNLIDLITEATNTQTAINYKDKISNKHFNKWAADFFAGKGVKYVSKRGEIMPNNLADGLDESVTSEVAIKFWYATFNGNPRRAKVSKTGILQEVFLATKNEDPKLADLFSGDKDSPIYNQLYGGYKIYKFVTKKRKESDPASLDDFILHADELISYCIYIELNNSGKVNSMEEDVLEIAYQKTFSRIKNIVEQERNKEGDIYSHAKYFKSEKSLNDYGL